MVRIVIGILTAIVSLATLIAERESSELARKLIGASYQRQGVVPEQLTLHADRGPAMISQTLAQLLGKLGVVKSHARPYTPDDNPFSEAQFKTMKYHPDYPDRFDSLDHARSWARTFFAWYNQEHHHVSLGLMTPAVVHSQGVDEVRASRQRVLDEAYAAHPERFTNGRPLAPKAPEQVWINPPHSVTDSAIVPAETQLAAQKASTTSLNGHNSSSHPAIEGPSSPAWEEKCSLFSINELSQIA